MSRSPSSIPAEAERAVRDLRSAGIDDSAISIVTRHDGEPTTTTDGADEEVAKMW